MKKKRILVVEDNPDIRKNLVLLLGRQYTVFEAQDGQAGLEQYHREPPDLVLLDVTLPKMDGFTVCQNIRSTAAGVKVPIVMLTARSENIEILQGRVLGATKYLTKPYDSAELLREIAQCLPREEA